LFINDHIDTWARGGDVALQESSSAAFISELLILINNVLFSGYMAAIWGIMLLGGLGSRTCR